MPSQFKSLKELNAEFFKKRNEQKNLADENQGNKSDVIKTVNIQQETVSSEAAISEVIEEEQVTDKTVENLQETAEEVLEKNIEQDSQEQKVDEIVENLQETVEEVLEENVEQDTQEQKVDEIVENLQETVEEVLEENVEQDTQEQKVDEIVENLQEKAEELIEEDTKQSIKTEQIQYDDEVYQKLQGVVFESEEDKENGKQSLNEANKEQVLSFDTILKTLQDAEKRLGMVDTNDDEQENKTQQKEVEQTENKIEQGLSNDKQEELKNTLISDKADSNELQVKKEVDLKTEISSEKDNKNIVFNKIKNIIRILTNIVFYCIIIFIIIGAIVIAVGSDGPGSSLFGYKFYQVNTTSMSPEYVPGDLLIVKETNVNIIEVNDAITYHPNKNSPEYLTHRVAEKIENYEETGYPAFRTKGDANLSNDSYIVEHSQIIGVVQYKIPGMGRFARIILDNTLLVIVILVLLVVLCVLVRALFGIKYKPRIIKISFVQKND